MSQAFERARRLHTAGRLAQARTAYAEVAVSDRNGTFWAWQALLAWQTAQPELAFAQLDRAAELKFDLAAGWPRLAPLESDWLELLLAAPRRPERAAWLIYVEARCRDHGLRLRIWRALLPEWAEHFHQRLAQSPWPEGLALLASHYAPLDPRRSRALWQLLQQIPGRQAAAEAGLGHLALQAGELEQALGHYRRALELEPLQPELNYHLGRLLLSCLEPQQARLHFDLALQQAQELEQAHPLWEVQRALAYSPLAEAGPWLAELLQAAEHLRQSVPLAACFEDLLRGGIEPCFDLNYLTEDDGPLRAAFADIFIPPPGPEPARGRRLGVFLSPGHEGLFLFSSRLLLRELAAAGVQLVIAILPASRPAVAELAAFAEIVELPPSLPAAARSLRRLELDLLYYWECGTDPLNYFLPMLRPARRQFTSWCSVSTTGLSQMDCFVSAEGLETVESPVHYREALYCLPVLPYLYTAEMLPHSGKNRQQLGLPAGELLACPHNPHKLNPAFLAAVREILQGRPRAQLVLIASRHAAWQRLFEARIRQALDAEAQRVIWLPRQSSADFGALLTACDLILEPFAYGSGKLAFEALGQGVPMLALPGRRLRGRIVSACYQQMNHAGLVVDSGAEYVSRAIALLQDPAALADHRQRLLANRNLLMQHPQVIPSLQLCLEALTAG